MNNATATQVAEQVKSWYSANNNPLPEDERRSKSSLNSEILEELYRVAAETEHREFAIEGLTVRTAPEGILLVTEGDQTFLVGNKFGSYGGFIWSEMIVEVQPKVLTQTIYEAVNGSTRP